MSWTKLRKFFGGVQCGGTPCQQFKETGEQCEACPDRGRLPDLSHLPVPPMPPVKLPAFQVTRLALRDGDRLVVRAPGRLPMEAYDRIREAVTAWALPATPRVLVLADGLELAVLESESTDLRAVLDEYDAIVAGISPEALVRDGNEADFVMRVVDYLTIRAFFKEKS